MTDGMGVMMLMNAVGKMARGFAAPSVLPVWDRERLTASNPPSVAFRHHEYDQFVDQHQHQHQHQPQPHGNGDNDLVQRSFLLGSADELATLRSHVPSHVKQFSTFDILSACLWRCCTIALALDPDDEVRMSFAVTHHSPPGTMAMHVPFQML